MNYLVQTAGSGQVAALVKRTGLLDKLETHDIRGEFVNVDIDANGEGFLKGFPNIAFVGKSKLISTYISNERDIIARRPVGFDILGQEVAVYVVLCQ